MPDKIHSHLRQPSCKMAKALLFVAFLIFAIVPSTFSKAIKTRNLQSTHPDKLFGGNLASLGQFPHHATFLLYNYINFCSGAILNSRWVLTAARCIPSMSSPDEFERISLLFGVNSRDDNVTQYAIEGIVLHPNFMEINNGIVDNNVALVRTKLPIEFSERVQPIELSTVHVLEDVPAVVADWEPRKVYNRINFNASLFQYWCKLEICCYRILKFLHR